MPNKKPSIVIYHPYIPKLGGIETVIYNLSKGLTLNGWDVTVLYGSSDGAEPVFHYSDYATVVKASPSVKLEVNVCLISSNHVACRNFVKADKWLQWIHADYEKYKLDLVRNPEVTKYIAVSQHVANIAKRLFDVDAEVIYNLIDPDFGTAYKETDLRLVTNSRISPEKGFKRMYIMAGQLKEKGIKFQWDIYGDNTHDTRFRDNTIKSFAKYPEVHFRGFKQDVSTGLLNADYSVLLSDFEGCPLAVLESLQCNVPVITTDYPSAKELIQNGKNGYIVSMDMKNIDYDRIKNEIPKDFVFKPLATIEQWEKILKE